jgi:5-methylcytosine-specific restriction endonuclease McrA|nr:MAG TPA: HNH endonuclease bacteriophage, HNH Endonuclease, DNA.52A [Caudoviricetes sp.]
MFDYKARRWERLRAQVMRRDGYRCQLSKRFGKAVPADLVHHIYPVDEFPEYAFEPWNLISVSRAAHNKLHDRDSDKLTAEGVALMRRTIPPE